MHLKIYKYVFVTLLIGWMLASCKKDAVITDSSAKLDFSTDTVLFDTVFATVGSTTHQFRVYNNNKKNIVISSIRLAGGGNSQFRINVDGLSGTYFEEVEIPPNDSIYVFVEVTIDPSSGTLPFIINDSVVFVTNGNTQSVILNAWGQDAHFFNGTIFCDMNWTNDKPYVIYNSILVDSGCTLTIDPGVLVYSNNYSAIYVKGTLDVNGTVDDPVVFQADRLESFYQDIPGQWLGIFLLRGSVNNSIDHAEIKNAFYGVSVGSHDNPDLTSFTDDNAPDVVIDHSIIHNMTYTGIFGFFCYMVVRNTLVYDCGQHNAHLAFGGLYDFTHVTLANYGTENLEHADAVLEMGNFAISGGVHASVSLDVTFTNCIVDGSIEDEIVFDDDNISSFDYVFENCVLKTTMATSGVEFISVQVNKSPVFVSIADEDYHLSSNSPCVDAGKVTTVTDDLEENPRDANPDIGAYEYIP